MAFELTILGSGSATPTLLRNPSAQYLYFAKQHFLIDCGEGTQSTLRRFEIRSHQINHIFISHLHGDHYLGLIGLLSTMQLHGRKNALHLFGPRGLDEILTVQFRYSDTRLNYKLIFHELDTETSKVILNTEEFSVETIPLDHRIPCCGFLFKEKPAMRKLIKEKLPNGLSLIQIAKLRKGEDLFDESGELLHKNEDLSYPQEMPLSYAYCSDTQYSTTVIEAVQGVSLLYHEATFLNDLLIRAKDTYHTTAAEAGQIAALAQVKQLLIGHYSARYRTNEAHLEEAKQYFTNTITAEDGLKIVVNM